MCGVLTMILLPTDRTIMIANTLCPYCGGELRARDRTRDHVLARKFVPQGTLVNSANIGLWACSICNGLKSQLEDDISAITMLPDTNGRFARNDERLRRSSARKARGSVSAATRKRVEHSHPRMNLNLPIQNASLNVGFTGHPEIDDERAAQLAWMQLQGFWFFQGFDRSLGWGARLTAADFHLVGLVSRADWGNPQIRAFESEMKSLDPQLHAVLAEGYFRATVRRYPGEQTLAWAVEWNEAFRCFGYWGPIRACEEKAESLPALEMTFLAGDTTNGIAFRIETALAEEDDTLFDPPPEMMAATMPETPHWR